MAIIYRAGKIDTNSTGCAVLMPYTHEETYSICGKVKTNCWIRKYKNAIFKFDISLIDKESAEWFLFSAAEVVVRYNQLCSMHFC